MDGAVLVQVLRRRGHDRGRKKKIKGGERGGLEGELRMSGRAWAVIKGRGRRARMFGTEQELFFCPKQCERLQSVSLTFLVNKRWNPRPIINDQLLITSGKDARSRSLLFQVGR